jgi:3-oxoacyl-[acyl-carrier protein] reductase
MSRYPSPLAGKVALVTGGSSGIGAEIARRLSRAGAFVAVAGHSNAAGAQAVADEIVAQGGAASPVMGDASSEAGVAALLQQTMAAFGRLDILVNNAGISTFMPFGAISADTIDRELATNVRSVVLMTQAAAALLGEGGRIVNISSNLAFGPMPGLTVYSASKAAVASLTKGLSLELAGRGITVNAVAPGVTATPMKTWIDETILSDLAAKAPLGRIAQPDDIADAVFFLCSDESRWVNGRTLIVDGGLL